MATPAAAQVGLHHLMFTKISPHDDPEAFIELFEHATEACAWMPNAVDGPTAPSHQSARVPGPKAGHLALGQPHPGTAPLALALTVVQ